MLNERKLSNKELDKRAEAIQGLLSNKRTLVKKYGKDAEKVMYGIATKQAKSKVEDMNKEKIKELIQLALQKEVETTPITPHPTTDLTKTVDTGFSGRADYGEEDKALESTVKKEAPETEKEEQSYVSLKQAYSDYSRLQDITYAGMMGEITPTQMDAVDSIGERLDRSKYHSLSAEVADILVASRSVLYKIKKYAGLDEQKSY